MANQMQKDENQKILTFVSRTAPYGSNRPQLCLDAALAAAIFDQDVNLVFLGDGVLQLIKNQSPQAISSKPLSSTLETLDLYGIKNIYIDQDSMTKNHLLAEDLVLDGRPAGKEVLSELFENSSAVFNL